MVSTPSTDEVVRALSEAWSRPGAVTDGFRFTAARSADGAIEVVFRWRRDPQPYAIRFPHPGWVQDVLGEAFGADDAVAELGLWLTEELDTGFVGQAERRRVGELVMLVVRPFHHSGWFVGQVPLRSAPTTGPGRHLDRDGLDGSVGRAAVEDGSLIAWLQLDRGDAGSPELGQAVVVRVDTTTAAIARLELRTDDGAAREDLVLAACRAAVEAGAERVVADRALDLLVPYGFTERDGRLEAAYDEVRPAR